MWNGIASRLSNFGSMKDFESDFSYLFIHSTILLLLCGLNEIPKCIGDFLHVGKLNTVEVMELFAEKFQSIKWEA